MGIYMSTVSMRQGSAMGEFEPLVCWFRHLTTRWFFRQVYVRTEGKEGQPRAWYIIDPDCPHPKYARFCRPFFIRHRLLYRIISHAVVMPQSATLETFGHELKLDDTDMVSKYISPCV